MPKAPFLLACSGGPDSIAALYILNELGYKVNVGHCNFKLRDNASDEDAKLVEEHCLQLQIPFFITDFDTTAYAEKNKLSIQEAARILRYNWLEKIRKENGLHQIITAHHKDDQVETMILQMAKGCGIKGLSGIPVKQGKIVRPLLGTMKEDILTYLNTNNIEYRIDASNKENKYTRNFIRNAVIPDLQRINPKTVHHLASLGQKAKEAQLLLEERIAQIRKRLVIKRINGTEIKFLYIAQHPAGATILYELLKKI